EPATGLPAVAAAALATTRAVARTDLLGCLRRLSDGSRTPTPEGSRRGFPWGDVAWPLNPCPADYRPAFASSLPLYPQPRRLTLRLAFPRGRATGFPRSAGGTPGWFRSRLSAGGAPAASEEFGASDPGHVPFWPKPNSEAAVGRTRPWPFFRSTFGLSFMTT